MVSLQLRLCLTFLPAAASLRLGDLGRRLCLLFDLCLCPLVAEKASGECYRLFCAPGDEAILTTGFGVVLPRVFFGPHSCLDFLDLVWPGGRMAVAGGSRPREDASGLWNS